MVALVRQWEQGRKRARYLRSDMASRWRRSTTGSGASAEKRRPPLRRPLRQYLVSEARTEVDGSIDVVLASGERLTVRAGASVDLLRTILVALRPC